MFMFNTLEGYFGGYGSILEKWVVYSKLQAKYRAKYEAKCEAKCEAKMRLNMR